MLRLSSHRSCRAGSSTPARASTVSAVRVLLTWLGVASSFSELVIPAPQLKDKPPPER